jgi:transposase
MANNKFTFQQFKTQYPDDDACLQAIFDRRYPRQDACPQCGIIGKLTKIEGRRAYACKEGCHTYPCAGTIFEHSSTKLTLWFHAMYLMTSTRNGVSAKELERQLGVTYKCAWRIGHQLRLLMSARAASQNPGPMSGHVELDETYIGGRRKGMGKGNYAKNKSIVFGMVQRKGHVIGTVIPKDSQHVIIPIVRESVAKGTTISTDQHGAYKPLGHIGYTHARVNHQMDEWVRGDVHTNTMEGFWSHLKRGIKSTHASVSRQHLQKYVDEFAFRYNNREAPADMFQRLVRQVSRADSSS